MVNRFTCSNGVRSAALFGALPASRTKPNSVQTSQRPRPAAFSGVAPFKTLFISYLEPTPGRCRPFCRRAAPHNGRIKQTVQFLHTYTGLSHCSWIVLTRPASLERRIARPKVWWSRLRPAIAAALGLHFAHGRVEHGGPVVQVLALPVAQQQ